MEEKSTTTTVLKPLFFIATQHRWGYPGPWFDNTPSWVPDLNFLIKSSKLWSCVQICNKNLNMSHHQIVSLFLFSSMIPQLRPEKWAVLFWKFVFFFFKFLFEPPVWEDDAQSSLAFYEESFQDTHFLIYFYQNQDEMLPFYSFVGCDVNMCIFSDVWSCKKKLKKTPDYEDMGIQFLCINKVDSFAAVILPVEADSFRCRQVLSEKNIHPEECLG